MSKIIAIKEKTKGENSNIALYRRILKYPPFAIKRKTGVMKIRHNVKSGYVESVAPEYVTVEDAEKLFIAISTCDKIKENFKVHASVIRKFCNANDNNYIMKALERLTKLTITYNFPNKKRGALHLVNRVELDYETGFIEIHLEPEFARLCRVKGLKLNIEIFSKLSPVAKNLYMFITSNYADTFTEDLLIERTVIQTDRKDNAQKLLKKAMEELVTHKAIKSYQRYKKDKVWFYRIKRFPILGKILKVEIKESL